MDNIFSFVCMVVGLYYRMYHYPNCESGQICDTLSLLILLISVYSAVFSLLFLLDILAVILLPHTKPNEGTNVRIVLKDKDARVVDVMYGKCHSPVNVIRVDFRDDTAILEAGGTSKLPTISVGMEHIKEASFYLPYISISYMSDVNDVFVINRSQATKKFLRRYFYGRFSKKVATSLASNMIEYVESKVELSCFCFEIPI